MSEAKHSVYHSSVLDADPDTVWSQVRDMMQVLKIVFGDAIEEHWVKGLPRSGACGATDC